MRRLVSILMVTALLAGAGWMEMPPAEALAADAASVGDVTAPRLLANGDVVSSITIGEGQTYTLAYRQARQDIQVRNKAGANTVFRIPPGHDPSLVGAATRIRFLPPSLQPYEGRGVLLFIASQRTRAGAGGGLCGAGVETYLKVLDIRSSRPRVVASHLIASCAHDIELKTGDRPGDTLYSFSVEGGRLAMRFLSYEGVTRSSGILGILSDDCRTLVVANMPR